MGAALKEAGLARDDIYVTSKYSGVGTISEAIEQSLKKVCSSLFSLFVFFFTFELTPRTIIRLD